MSIEDKYVKDDKLVRNPYLGWLIAKTIGLRQEAVLAKKDGS
jgi:hypothetical protein